MQKQTWNGSLHVLLVDIDNLAGSSNARVGDNEGQGSPSYVSVFAKLRYSTVLLKSSLFVVFFYYKSGFCQTWEPEATLKDRN